MRVQIRGSEETLVRVIEPILRKITTALISMLRRLAKVLSAVSDRCKGEKRDLYEQF